MAGFQCEAAQEKRDEWAEFLGQYSSVMDPDMSEAVANTLRELFSMFFSGFMPDALSVFPITKELSTKLNAIATKEVAAATVEAVLQELEARGSKAERLLQIYILFFRVGRLEVFNGGDAAIEQELPCQCWHKGMCFRELA